MYDRTGTIDMWTFVEPAWSSIDVAGFGVEAIDGGIGTVDEATREAGASYLVVDTGPWIFGKKVMLPAGIISRVDADARQVYVGLTKGQIQDAPEFDELRYREPTYRDDLAAYYGANRPAGPDYGRDDRPF
jgi:hypothetical protein